MEEEVIKATCVLPAFLELEHYLTMLSHKYIISEYALLTSLSNVSSSFLISEQPTSSARVH